MKLKTRLAVAFLTVTVVPMLLIFMAFMGLTSYQTSEIRKNYDLQEPVEILSANSMQIFSRLTESSQTEIREKIAEDPGAFEDPAYLDQLNAEILRKYAYTIVRKGSQIIYEGNPSGGEEDFYSELPPYGNGNEDIEGGIYLDGDSQHLLKQIDFVFPDGEDGSLFLVSNVDELIPEVESMLREMVISGILILCFTGVALTTWVYRSIWRPLGQLQQATKNIRDGNLDFTLEVENEDDELGRLCMDFEEMRIRLKESAEEKVQYDKESKELISNISHDLKTPITAIKGYVEGILDGVASSPEKLDKYIRTIYNKANDMDRLIDELTFYSKIDTNKIPYTFAKINVAEYFGDCVEEVGLDLDARGIELGYFNYVDKDVVIIADAEQMKRVINNIIGNSIKYMDKKRGIINIRIQDVGDFIQVGIEDNGRGIAARDLPNIFDRFYRTDASRNSSKGGSGIGLSIVKKIIEDHGGRIWATSKEGIGTEIHFVLRKYQEVIQE